MEGDLMKRELDEDIAELRVRRVAKRRAMDRQLASFEISETWSVFRRWAEKVVDFGDLASAPNGTNSAGTGSGADKSPEAFVEQDPVQSAMPGTVKLDVGAGNVQTCNSEDDSDWEEGMFTPPRSTQLSRNTCGDVGKSAAEVDENSEVNENDVPPSPPHRDWNFSNWNSAYNSTRMNTANPM
ncbi:hypothetical protein KC19_VG008600 [Ceratodon purpureus]|uniref:Uncharacterized protein n=1 Tax=Ceratodon purpureus TaxID=3225 RepID=A0A8T0HKQ9_CERPU|nr:hypothetical protein KC19_VG008600 [Ceratodon purpureus]